jgi:hypothetical protein
MAGTPRCLVENFLSVRQFASHTITAEENSATSFRVGAQRRLSTYVWQATTVSSDTWLRVQCDRSRCADMIVFDRGHNMEGQVVTLQGSDDGTTWVDIFSVTTPTVSMPGALGDLSGVRTEEGAWVKSFPAEVYLNFRLFFPAAASLTPKLVGVWIGKSWESRVFDFPWGDEQVTGLASVEVLEHGWEGRNETTPQRSGVLTVRHDNYVDYDQTRYNVLGHWALNRAMWIVADREQADRAVLAQMVQGAVANYVFDGERLWRVGLPINWQEYYPKRV